ncbi:MAG: YihA family ribosome biogenesis GTP-binding protein [Thiotrichales bacterium]|nr:MAG: YihA family ribosome biogenesis GTP-binding protein [Thiotrichales bacterium]
MPIKYNSAEYLLGTPTMGQLPQDSVAEIAFVGRSNVGKSSLINSLTNQKSLARISKTPGRTQLLNLFTLENHKYRLVDLPGFGYAKVQKSIKTAWYKNVNEYLTQRTNLKALILIMDIRREIQEEEQSLVEWCNTQQTPLHLVLNKQDKLSKSKAGQQLIKIKNMFANDNHVSVQTFSVLKKIGVSELKKRLDSYYKL